MVSVSLGVEPRLGLMTRYTSILLYDSYGLVFGPSNEKNVKVTLRLTVSQSVSLGVEPLLINGNHIVARLRFPWNVFTESLPSNGSIRHIVLNFTLLMGEASLSDIRWIQVNTKYLCLIPQKKLLVTKYLCGVVYRGNCYTAFSVLTSYVEVDLLQTHQSKDTRELGKESRAVTIGDCVEIRLSIVRTCEHILCTQH
jgi:hypothetical protein